ncbi:MULTISPECIES: toxin-antitoxin system YwqK family antitoxin [Cetobacterium]|uniref:Toxin-antitoxin system YwqK family antitoxin n=1 Tax=Candidatus Cetobacterium colombiensis TaxID=3073100 RepID=A0ABU4W6W6_9FUSO|nr:toxin-antitoxin system YwqK family antitoxin [Candidatus Cetobacterium colombiensis]MDX8335268.1 toxin-antitoxin system YwqK family antitoxin [Candidatus Cetobacterium colombiensis]
MKKMKIVVGVILLTLIGCTPLERNETNENLILLPTVPKGEVEEGVSNIGGEFIPQTDIIHTGQNVSLADTGITQIKLNGIDQVSIGNKQIRGGIAYNGNSTTPYTGTFAAVVGVHKHYTEEYKNGKLNGNKTWYSEAGRVGMREPYVDGRKNGVQETYYRNTGNIRSRINYSGGRISGPATWYDNSGKILHQEDFKGGNGEWVAYWDNGKIREKGRLSNGLPNGEWRHYTQKGDVEKITVYRNGSPISQEWLK